MPVCRPTGHWSNCQPVQIELCQCEPVNWQDHADTHARACAYLCVCVCQFELGMECTYPTFHWVSSQTTSQQLAWPQQESSHVESSGQVSYSHATHLWHGYLSHLQLSCWCWFLASCFWSWRMSNWPIVLFAWSTYERLKDWARCNSWSVEPKQKRSDVEVCGVSFCPPFMMMKWTPTDAYHRMQIADYQLKWG